MLSKLRFFAQQNHAARHPTADMLRAAQQHFDTVLEPLEGGTLGVCFTADIQGQQRFLKTHRDTPEGRSNLVKEIDLLQHIYGARLSIAKAELAGQVWLVMDRLTPLANPTPEQAKAVIADYAARLASYAGAIADDFAMLQQEAAKALQHLQAAGLLSPTVAARVAPYLALLQTQDFPRLLCHGDLGPKNVMLHASGPVAIDWEDAFWGIAGYDDLYWLSFFSQRVHYSPAMFGKTPWGREREIAILLLILVIKCELAVRSNTHHGNQLSFDERLMEMLHLAA